MVRMSDRLAEQAAGVREVLQSDTGRRIVRPPTCGSRLTEARRAIQKNPTRIGGAEGRDRRRAGWTPPLIFRFPVRSKVDRARFVGIQWPASTRVQLPSPSMGHEGEPKGPVVDPSGVSPAVLDLPLRAGFDQPPAPSRDGLRSDRLHRRAIRGVGVPPVRRSGYSQQPQRALGLFWLLGQGPGLGANNFWQFSGWILLSLLYFLVVVAGAALVFRSQRHLTAVYNADQRLMQRCLVQVCERMGLDPVRSGNLFVFGIEPAGQPVKNGEGVQTEQSPETGRLSTYAVATDRRPGAGAVHVPPSCHPALGTVGFGPAARSGGGAS